MTLTQGHGCGTDWHKFACLHDKVRSTHPITTILNSYIALAMLITWLHLGGFTFCDFFQSSRYDFARSNTLLNISLEWLFTFMWNRKKCIGWVNYVIVTFDLTHEFDLEFFKVKFWNSSFKIAPCLELLVWLVWSISKQKYVTLTFDYKHGLGLDFSRAMFEINLSQKSEGRLTCNERDVSRSFMTMTVTFVWPWWGGWMNGIVTEVTSDVGMSSTHLVFQVSLYSRFHRRNLDAFRCLFPHWTLTHTYLQMYPPSKWYVIQHNITYFMTRSWWIQINFRWTNLSK